MKEVVLVLMMLGLFVFTFFLAARIGGFLEANYRGGVHKSESRSVPVMFADGKNAAETAQQLRKLGNAYGQCAIIVCDAKDPDIIDYIDPEYIDNRYQIG